MWSCTYSLLSLNDSFLYLKDFTDVLFPLRILGRSLIIPRAVLDGEDVSLLAGDLTEAGVQVRLVGHYHSLQVGNRWKDIPSIIWMFYY